MFENITPYCVVEGSRYIYSGAAEEVERAI
jgi:hypothetical protein